jgi:excisionase family DNA binding protein
MAMAELKVYTIEEVVNLLHVTRRTVYSYIKEGKLKAVKIGKYWRVTEKNLEDFLSKGTK